MGGQNRQRDIKKKELWGKIRLKKKTLREGELAILGVNT